MRRMAPPRSRASQTVARALDRRPSACHSDPVPPYDPLLRLGVGLLERLGRWGVVNGKRVPSSYGFVSKYKSLRFDTARARNDLDWQPTVGLEEGLRRTFDWYRNGHA